MVFGFERQPSGSGANTWANSWAGVGKPNCRRTRACSARQPRGMHHTPQTCPPLDQPVAAKQPQQRLRRPMPFRRGGLGRHALTVEPLQQLVGGQRHLHQTDQRLDTPRRLEEHRTDRQRRLPLVVAQLHIILLLELGEQRVAALLPRCRRQQRRQPVVVGRRGRRRLVELIVEAVAWAGDSPGPVAAKRLAPRPSAAPSPSGRSGPRPGCRTVG